MRDMVHGMLIGAGFFVAFSIGLFMGINGTRYHYEKNYPETRRTVASKDPKEDPSPSSSAARSSSSTLITPTKKQWQTTDNISENPITQNRDTMPTNTRTMPVTNTVENMRLGEIGLSGNICVGLQYVKRMSYLPTALGEETENVGYGNEVILAFFDFYNDSEEENEVRPGDITCYADGVQVSDIETVIKVECDNVRQFDREDLSGRMKLLSVEDFAVPGGWNELKFYYKSDCSWVITQQDVSSYDYVPSSMYPKNNGMTSTPIGEIVYNGDYEVTFQGAGYYTESTIFENRDYVYFKYTVNNTNSTAIDYSSAGYRMTAYQNDYMLDDANFTLEDKIDGYINIFDLDSIQPGMVANLYVAFEVFKKDGDLYMVYDDGWLVDNFKGSVYVE